MKKLLVILLLTTPFIGFGQACQYGSSTDASSICNFYQSRSFATYRNADIALDKILDVTGMAKRFVLKECNDISNCLATTYNGIRYILYDRDFMDAIATRTNSWSSTSILAHEIGHHVNGHTLGEESTLSESRQMEIEADEYSGFVMFKLGASLSQAQEAIRVYGSNKDDSYSTHPARDKRLRAIERGYNKAKGQGSNNDYPTNSSTLTAEDYFYKAYNNESDYQYQIDNYTKCLRIDPNYGESDGAITYYNRGLAYGSLENYEDAIADYTRAIRIDPDYVDAYYNRGITYSKLGNYENEIADYTRAIRIDPDYASAYKNRGISKEATGLPYCSDYKRACDLGKEKCCEWYNKQCQGTNNRSTLTAKDYYDKANDYFDNEEYQLAINNYTKAIRIDPDYTIAYLFRGDAYSELENHEDAIADYTRAIRIDPDDAYSYYTRGNTYKDLKNYEDAIADYTRAIRVDPDYAYAYRSRGSVSITLGNYNDAITDCTKAISLEPKGSYSYYLRGIAKENAGLSYCSDYKEGCNLGDEDCCEFYNEQCR